LPASRLRRFGCGGGADAQANKFGVDAGGEGVLGEEAFDAAEDFWKLLPMND